MAKETLKELFEQIEKSVGEVEDKYPDGDNLIRSLPRGEQILRLMDEAAKVNAALILWKNLHNDIKWNTEQRAVLQMLNPIVVEMAQVFHNMIVEYMKSHNLCEDFVQSFEKG